MDVARTVGELRARMAERAVGGVVTGLFPTMGALHQGHLSLARRMVDDCDLSVVSVFVNPLQFAPGEDFEAYPRDLDSDLDKLRRLGVDIVFVPDATEFTPPQRVTTVHVAALTDTMEGASRPGHFDGVATIVTKLLNAARPHRAYFSDKDYQQLQVVRRLVADLDIPTEIVACPFLREPDGLAMSSRNTRLSPHERAQALALSRALREAAQAWDGDSDAARQRLRQALAQAPGVELDYAEIAHPDTLAALTGHHGGPARALAAARVGPVRLIDNIALPAASA